MFHQITSKLTIQEQIAKNEKKSNFDTFSEKCVLPTFRKSNKFLG